ncbi:hypothetical protein FGL74_06995 [Leuconostoc koreense]|nr:hypothetical protein FGL74_06995 [Leuconostoc mesenteroides]QGM25348.1 hypothetical protein GJV51_04960 [Leuconostoc mesenteroides subsp. mesenteroides]
MKNKQLHIDPEKFALQFLESFKLNFDTKNLEGMAKQQLAAYLSAYFLVEKFNEIESKNFDQSQPSLSDLGFDELLKHVSELNNY